MNLVLPLETGTLRKDRIPALRGMLHTRQVIKQMTKLIAMVLIGAAVTSVAFGVYETPEIDVNSGLGALTLLSGAVLVLRSRYRK